MKYQSPSDDLAVLVDITPPPVISLSPDDRWILLIQPAGLPSIEELANPELRLAGIRINPLTNGKSRQRFFCGFSFLSLQDHTLHPVTGLPSSPKVDFFSWSPDSKYIAFTLHSEKGIAIWIVSLSDFRAVPFTAPVLNDVLYGATYSWLPDSSGIMYRCIMGLRGEPPVSKVVPDGPVIQENTGTTAPVRTYQDLLRNNRDEALFEYYATSVLVYKSLEGEEKGLTKPSIIGSFSISPDGSSILVEEVVRPFSYLVPYDRFAGLVKIIDRSGKLVRLVAEIPVAEDIPKGFSSVRKGPREFEWRSDAPAELWWAEALDDGDASSTCDARDRLFRLAAPFSENPVACLDLPLRFDGFTWFDGNLAMVDQSWWDTRRRITARFSPDHPAGSFDILFDKSFEDAYGDPGFFITHPNQYGKNILLSSDKGQTLYLIGDGASPEGDRPFLDTLNVAHHETARLWRSAAPFYEMPYFLTGDLLITRRESVEDPPNFFLRNVKENTLLAITHYPHPYPQLRRVHKEFIQYKRADGIPLTGTLYLPYPEKEKNKNLPVLMWAYPQEFRTASAAGQVKDSPYRFLYISWASPLFWLAKGYAILDDPSLPIIGEGDNQPNDTYTQQLIAGAKAAVDKLVDMGIADPKRIAIGGHSYGAFMTANLLAHSDLFAAGIARSGAYNRTLTPFGFQAEERTLWEAPEIYMNMSPFMVADKIKAPLLLIHGESDNNSGTFFIQSERFYAALKGHGAIVRFVTLPLESHAYRARESILHMIWEMDQWLDQWVIKKGVA